ncbi:MAG TPA: Calx-beta domain-containing protein, partial [Pyrinomonadaceae bacterium]|nr:Calx-beta domain-containing protein [Pyrinomonadaceae bacterium]
MRIPTYRSSTRLLRLAAAVLFVSMLSWGVVPERFWNLLQPKAEAAFFTVTTTADNGNNAAPTPGSLRQAIINANATAALDFIKFNIGSGLKTIKPPTPLPTITQPVYIDGTSQPGWSGLPLIEIDGSLAGANAKGLYITGGGSTVRYIVVNRFSSDGIALATGSNNTVVGCFIGTDYLGASDQGNGGNGISIFSSSSNNGIGGISNLRNVISGNTGAGIAIGSGANGNKIRRNFIGTNDGGTAAIPNSGYGININNSANNVIGGTANAGNINVISGNQRGILITGIGANGNLIQNNYIGTNFDATADLGNVEGGIDLYGSGNTVGGTVVAARNIISGNGTNGIFIGGVGNLVKGNYIGTNKAGTAAIANGSYGIRMIDAFNNTIGGTTPEERNLISGNARGMSLEGNTFANTVLGNYIGTNFDGTAALGNTNGSGISLNAPSNTIGGLAAGAGNLISGNASGGITMSAAAENNKIQGNLIGTDKAGTAAIPNNSYGIRLIDGTGNLIGGTVSSGRNVVSGNARGISIEGSGGTDNTVKGNYIGTDINGTADLGNNGSGIEISGPANYIGGTAAGEGNVISGNSSNGIAITGVANFNLVQGNLIGTDKNGTAAIPNNSYGIRMIGVSNNTIGGTAAGARNLISGNARGMSIEGTSSTGNKVQGNLIGTNFNGNAALGNSGSGVEVGGVSNLIGGDVAGARNIISGNLQGGITIVGSDVTDNKVQGNYIGTDASGNADVGNGSYGIRMINAHDNLIGGTTAGAGNVISGNERGMSIEGASGSGNKVQGNRIGTNAAGTAVLGNDGSGVELGGPNNQVGGTTAQERNIISGNKQGGVVFSGVIATGNKVQGNFIGPDVNGTGDLGNSGYAIRVYDAPANLIGGTAAGEGNVISGNERGISLEQNGGNDNIVQGNLIGTNAAGTAGLGNDGSGIDIFSANNLIGGTTAGARNVISANKQGGIVIRGNKATGNKIQGNYIGTKADGVSPLSNTFLGVQTSEAFNNLIGGTAAGAGNVIASNSFHGVFIDSGHGNSVLGNSIFNNVRQGIDLAPYGVDINDTGDADNGPNKKQNYPILSSVTVAGATTAIMGTLNSTPNTQFRIEFFSNPACDPSGFGEGKTFIGAKTITTNAAGDVNINVTLPVAAPDNYVTATVTSNSGNTSEFSPCALVGGPNPGTFQFSQDYYIAQENEPNMVITVTRSGGTTGTVSVDYETVADSATSPADYTHTAGTLVFNDGEVVKTFTVPIAYDTLDEGNQEQLFLKLTNATGGATIGAQNNVILYIIDYDLTFPTTYVSDVQMVEGNAGTTNAVFTITMSPHSQNVSVGYNTSDGTALAGSDYTAKSGTVIFTPAQTTKTISVPVIGDIANEDDELFYFKINAVNNGSVSDAVGDGLIINDDGASGLQLSSATYNVNEGGANATITVNRTGSSGGTVTVNYATSDGTATAPADYTTKTGTLTFGNGVTSQTFNIPIVNDPVDEPNETINVTLSNA